MKKLMLLFATLPSLIFSMEVPQEIMKSLNVPFDRWKLTSAQIMELIYIDPQSDNLKAITNERLVLTIGFTRNNQTNIQSDSQTLSYAQVKDLKAQENNAINDQFAARLMGDDIFIFDPQSKALLTKIHLPNYSQTPRCYKSIALNKQNQLYVLTDGSLYKFDLREL